MKRFEYPNMLDYDIMALMTESYGIITNRKFDKKNAQILANTGYGLSGIAFNLVLGHPDNFGDISPEQGGDLIESVEFKKLDREVDHFLLVEKRFSGETVEVSAEDAEAIDPLTILMLIETIAKVIKLLRERKKR